MNYPLPANEAVRLQALRDYELLDTAREKEYDSITLIASTICTAPVSIITLLDESRQWFKSAHGIPMTEMPRETAFCNHTILQTTPLIVPDLKLDARFSDNPLVLNDPHVRFYAGAPLITPNGFALGSVCVVDVRPRELSLTQINALAALASQVVGLMELRRVANNLAEAMSKVKMLQGLLPICSFCKGIRDDHGYWSRVEDYITTHADVSFTHGICAPCAREHFPECVGELEKTEGVGKRAAA